ncbi:hypothetical protein PybrP1_001282, partial [[Pythium] brassicae (nom. inval.)]
EFYDDWGTFDAAVAAAIALHHPIRKRSSLTFEVYNRTVSKGRHDRKSIAEFLSKTFKCTHGIKFRSRGKGRRQRHKPRDIGCPFHIYASAVEFGATYRVKVRTHDRHNHPIGPDAIKNMPGLIDSDYELEGDAPAPPNHPAHSPAPDQALDQAQAQLLMKAQQQAIAHAQEMLQMAREQAQADEVQAREQAEAQARLQAEAHARAQAQALLHAQAAAQAAAEQAQAQAAAQAQAQAQAHEELLAAAAEHESASLLESAIEGSIGADFAGAPKDPRHEHSRSQDEHVAPAPAKFEPTTTLEAIRRKMAQFADERDWNQFHTPRNLVLALTGEVGELCELFQWRGDNNAVADWTPEEKEHLGEEMSDVLLYLVRLADQCNVDLSAAVHDKMAKNARKYPAELVKGSSKKYSEYKKRQRLDSAGNAASSAPADDSGGSTSTSATHSAAGSGPRDLLFGLLKGLGSVGSVLQRNRDGQSAKDWSVGDRALLSEGLAAVLVPLVLLAGASMLKNARKYPPKLALEPLVDGRAAPDEPAATTASEFRFEPASTLELFRLKTVHFADEREWPPNLTPRNLLLALSAEVGELCELFQWRGDGSEPTQWTPGERVHLGEELSDVLLYLVQLADRTFTDLAAAALAHVASAMTSST